MVRWPKATVDSEKCIGAESVRSIRRQRFVFVVCTAGAFIGCVDNVKSELVTRGEKIMKVR